MQHRNLIVGRLVAANRPYVHLCNNACNTYREVLCCDENLQTPEL
ncbi:MAG: hypothetical protein VB125_02200 [Burkholderia sp.]